MYPLNQKRAGIILAAGIGSRLNGLRTKQKLVKPLTSVDGLMLLLRAIRSLEKADCHKVVIVLGWQADKIKAYINAHYAGSTEIAFAFNQNYQLRNGLSVLCARPFVEEEFVLTMADHILDDKIMMLARNHRPPKDGATLCVDYKLDSIFDLEDATKVIAAGHLIKKIGKGIKGYNCVDTGVFIGTKGLMEAIEKIYLQKGDSSLSEGVQLLADKGRMEVLDIKDAFWQDVDTPEMLLHAEKLLRWKTIDPEKLASL
ncbi:MAG: NTP transferase domain-containing protein [Desulfobacterales bacterium]|nr:MAG: NTP transferase domain-containing protein [Desulfobacterales bacterium]